MARRVSEQPQPLFIVLFQKLYLLSTETNSIIHTPPDIVIMSDSKQEKPEEDVEDEEYEDLEKLQAEIARMEEEAARITKETEELEKKKANLTDSKPAVGADGEKPARDG
jgi:hypothetical protein